MAGSRIVFILRGYNMSRTYRKTFNGKTKAPGKQNREIKILEPSYKDYDWIFYSYSKSPSFWNHDFSTVPRRAKEKSLLKNIKDGKLDFDEVVFPDGKKPVIYYW